MARCGAATFLALAVHVAVPGLAQADNPIETVEAFRAAQDRADYEYAQTLLGDDPRVWYESREGAGLPVKLGAGRWSAWDDHFQSEGELGPWTVEGRSVWAVAEETNDYFRLLERRDLPRYRITYFLDSRGKIAGYMISAADPEHASPPSHDRFDEFQAWAITHHPDEWAYLRPGGKLDPTGDRAPRTRRLLEHWRESVGLPALD